MKNLLSYVLHTAILLHQYAGGASNDENMAINSMSSAKASSGVHFYGRMYIGYDEQTNWLMIC